MKYPAVSNYLNGTFVADDLPALDVYDPSEGSVISRVPLSSRREVDRAVESARAAFPGWAGTPIKERVQVFYRYKALLEQNHRRAGGAGHRGERQDRERGARRGAQVRRADRVRLLAAADRAGRSAGGEPRRRVPDRALPARRRRVDHAVQLPEHGAELDDPQRHRPRQLHDPQAVGAGSAERRPHRRAAARGGSAGRGAQGRARRAARRSRRSATIRASRRSASSARRRWPRSSTGAAPPNLKRVLALGGAKNHLIVMPDADRRDDGERTSSRRCPAAPASAAWRRR